jgi:hypothetical protein
VSDKNRIAIDIPKEAVAELEKMKKALHRAYPLLAGPDGFGR